jgi:hypothetical protein
MNDIRDDVHGILEFLGYGEIRTADSGQWQPLESVNGEYGTTNETRIVSRKNVPTCRLIDAGAGEQIATARKSEPVRTVTNRNL